MAKRKPGEIIDFETYRNGIAENEDGTILHNWKNPLDPTYFPEDSGDKPPRSNIVRKILGWTAIVTIGAGGLIYGVKEVVEAIEKNNQELVRELQEKGYNPNKTPQENEAAIRAIQASREED